MDKGYTRQEQIIDEKAPVPHIAGFALSSNPEDFIDADSYDTKESPENGKADGDNPNYTLPAFANGTDNRNRG